MSTFERLTIYGLLFVAFYFIFSNEWECPKEITPIVVTIPGPDTSDSDCSHRSWGLIIGEQYMVRISDCVVNAKFYGVRYSYGQPKYVFDYKNDMYWVDFDKVINYGGR